jgi:pyruvate/2-oxoglutarate dehydrogenase complex dihydrolipoamide acyltransferase (E2) component
LTHKRESKLICGVTGLLLVFRFDGERSRIQGAVSTRPEESAMGLIGLKVAEIAETAAAETATAATTAAAPAAATTAPAATTKTTSATAKSSSAASGSAASGSTTARTSSARATLAAKRRIHLCVLAKLFHIHPCEGIRRTSLAGDSY